MKTIKAEKISQKIAEACITSNYNINPEVKQLLIEAKEKETSFLAKDVLKTMLENFEIAQEKQLPICQDTGLVVAFVKMGQDIKIENGNLVDAINNGISIGYQEGFLRKSMVYPPIINRINTKDNTPAIIHFELSSEDNLEIIICPKGGGAENTSKQKMFNPTSSEKDIIDFAVEIIKQAKGMPCPPVIVGIGIGGNFEQSCILSKKALLSPLANKKSKYLDLEEKILKEINSLGIGPMGIGGKTTAIAVNILDYPCHIASLPVAINVQCYVHRHKKIVF